MSCRYMPKGKQSFAAGDIDFDAANIAYNLLQLDGTLTDTAVKAVEGATNATPVVITITGHGWSDGHIVVALNIGGNTSANGTYKIANSTANTFELQTLDGQNVVGNGAYTSGGCIINLTAAADRADIDGAQIGGLSGNLTSKTNVDGVLDADDPSFTGITGTAHAAMMLENTGTAATDELIQFNDGKVLVKVAADAAASATTLWCEPLEGDIADNEVMVFSNGVTATVNGAASRGDRSITVDALASGITAGHQADVTSATAGLPFTTSNGAVTLQLPAEGIGEI